MAKCTEDMTTEVNKALPKTQKSEHAKKIPTIEFNYRSLEDLKKISREEFAKLEWEAETMHDPKQQFDLARCYGNGILVTKNLEIAVTWYLRAADKKFPPAQYNLACCYFNHIGIPKKDGNNEKGFNLLIEAVNKNYAPAQNNLAQCYMHGIGTPKNPENLALAYQYFKKAIKNGYTQAESNLKKCEEAINKNFNALVKGLNLDLNQYKTEKTFVNHYTRYSVLSKITVEVFNEILKKATQKPDAEAKFNLARCYHHGIHCKENLDTALKFYHESAELDFVAAQITLAGVYKQKSLKNLKDIESQEQTFDWNWLAANHGALEALNNLGWCYEHNFGVERTPLNFQNAFYWYMVSAVKGFLPAKLNVIHCINQNIGLPNKSKYYKEDENAKEPLEEKMCLSRSRKPL